MKWLEQIALCGGLLLCPNDLPLEHPEIVREQAALAYSFLKDSLHLPPPSFSSSICPRAASLPNPDTGVIPWTRERSLWSKSTLREGKVRGFTEPIWIGGPLLISISPELPDSEIPSVLSHELTHDFQDALSKGSIGARHAEALATWTEWRLGYQYPFKQPMPWDRIPLRGFFDIPANVSYSWWLMFAGMPDSSIEKFYHSCFANCDEAKMDSVMPGQLDSAMTRLIAMVKSNPAAWLANSISRQPIRTAPDYSIQFVKKCPRWADSSGFRCTTIDKQGSLL